MMYFDNSATTRPCDAAVFLAREIIESDWYNPSAKYAEAMRVERRVDGARRALAALACAPGFCVTFTGGGTEADSLALLGAAARFRGGRRVLLFAAEHPSVLGTASQLAAMGHTVEMIPADDTGVIDLDALSAVLGGGAALVSCMHVNNETGAMQPISRVARLVREKCPDALLHVDGVQGFLRVPLPLSEAGVDLYAVSAHKVHGLKGVGALFARPGVKLTARVAGGGQESGLRSGTENTAGIISFAAAAAWVAAQADGPERLRAMKFSLFEKLSEAVPGLRVNGPAPDGPDAAPHILNVSLPGVGGEVMLHALEAEGVLVGTGAACSSKRREVSAAFRAMRAPAWAAENAIRFSFGLMNEVHEAAEAADAVVRCWRKYARERR